MSTLRTNTLQTLDGLTTIDIEDLAVQSDLNVYDISVASVAALKALDWTRYATARTLGYYSARDGGHGTYAKDTSDVISTDNGGTVLVATDGTRLKLLNTGSTNLFQWGCIGDGVFDCTARVQAAMNWAGPIAGEIVVPSVVGTFRLTSTITSTGSPSLRGVHIEISKTVLSLAVNQIGAGSWFYLDHQGIGFNYNDTGTVVKRPKVSMVGTIRNQPVPVTGTPYSPNLNDYDFRFFNCDSVVRDIVLWNTYRGVQLDCVPANSQSRGDISGVYGYPLGVGISIEFIADVLRIDNIHFWPYFSSNVEVINYVAATGAGIVSKRCDNPFLTRIFTYGYRFGLYIDNGVTGSTSKMKMSEFDFDAFGQCGIFINGTGASASFSQGSGQGGSSTTSTNFLEFSPVSSGCDISVSEIDAGLCAQSVFRVGGSANNVLRIGGNVRCFNWNGSNASFPAIAVVVNNLAILEDFPQFVAPLFSGKAFDSNGGLRARFSLSPANYTTDANGVIAVDFGLGRFPTVIRAAIVNSATPFVVQQISTPGQFKVWTANTAVPVASSVLTIALVAEFL